MTHRSVLGVGKNTWRRKDSTLYLSLGNETEKGSRGTASATTNAEAQTAHVLFGLLPRHGGDL